jgi:hypothetical protein
MMFGWEAAMACDVDSGLACAPAITPASIDLTRTLSNLPQLDRMPMDAPLYQPAHRAGKIYVNPRHAPGCPPRPRRRALQRRRRRDARPVAHDAPAHARRAARRAAISAAIASAPGAGVWPFQLASRLSSSYGSRE